ncbi:PilN domain-containing protein [Trinickia sp. NRRL B-1857]|uniref:PilN domain-containing protein n=1 Tax=Trinickia sp. NRRL B-1857 TaxID=3162879 RepID=UPI003D2B4A4E
MRRLSIDFAPFSVRRELSRVHPFALSLAVAGLLFCLLAGVRIHRLLSRLDSLDREAAHLAARAMRVNRRTAAASGEPIDPKLGSAVNSAIARLNVPWSDVLDALEAATPPQVFILSATPEAIGEKLKIEAQSGSPEQIVSYISALEQQPRFSSVYLMKHQRVRDGSADVIRFQIQAQWRESEH